MRVEAVELRVVELPLHVPFTSAHGTVRTRSLVLVHLEGPDGEGWGECAALPEPTYTSEWVGGALAALRDHLVPRLLAASRPGGGVSAADLGTVLGDVVGHPMAKAALELALLDAEARAASMPLARTLTTDAPPSTSVVGGVAIGLMPSPDELVDAVAARVRDGYRRVKIKIAPGRDATFVRAARHAAGPETLLVVDANASYRLDGPAGGPDDARALGWLDDLDVGFVEQPLEADDLPGHALLAERLATPICLDESLTSRRLTRHALEAGACSVVCVKAPRYGSWLEAAAILDHCAAAGVDAWIGGMLDGALGRRANLALAAHPGASLPGDVSATGATFADDVAPFMEPEPGSGPLAFAVPDGAGIGVRPHPDALGRLTTRVETIRLDGSVVTS